MTARGCLLLVRFSEKCGDSRPSDDIGKARAILRLRADYACRSGVFVLLHGAARGHLHTLHIAWPFFSACQSTGLNLEAMKQPWQHVTCIWLTLTSINFLSILRTGDHVGASDKRYADAGSAARPRVAIRGRRSAAQRRFPFAMRHRECADRQCSSSDRRG